MIKDIGGGIMNAREFQAMLVKYPESMDNAQKFESYMKDLYPEQKMEVNILVDLFKLDIVAKIKVASELDNAIFYQVKKQLSEVYGVSETVASECVEIWLKGYGEGVLGKVCSFSASEIPDVVLPNELGQNTVKTFADAPFKFNIPKLVRFDDRIEVSSTFTFKSSDPSAEAIIYQARFTDRIGVNFDSIIEDCVLLREKNAMKSVRFDIKTDGKHPSTQKAQLKIQIMTNGGAIYQLEYHTDDKHNVLFDGISSANQDDDEVNDYKRIVGTYFSKKVNKGNNNSGDIPSDGGGLGAPAQLIKIPEIEEYKKALLREKYFLQKEGGRKYKVTDGKKLNTNRGLVTYAFDMESELFLSDDAPITLKVGLREATGSVLVCEGFNISVMIDKDFGDTISSAMISVEPWKLLESQVNRLESINASDTLAIRLMQDGPNLATSETINMIAKGQNAAHEKIEDSDITIIWGPPGTGKSYTMANVAIDYLSQGKTVLMVSHSNISVDGVVNQVVDQLKTSGRNDWLRHGKVLRYGYVRDEKLEANRDAVAFNYALDRNPDLKHQMDILTEKKKTLKRGGTAMASQLDLVEKDLKKLRGMIRAEESKFVQKADMVATTISKAVIDHIFDDRKYDLVMFDEVSMAYVTQLICAARLAYEKFVCVGDFNQLSPIAQSEAAKVLQVDVFSYLGIIDSQGNIHNHEWLVMLDEQRRMLPNISAFPSKYVYKNLLKDHPSTGQKVAIANRLPLAGEAMSLVDLAGTYCAADKNMDNSRYNIVSALMSFALALQTEHKGNTEAVGVITPYAAQARLIGAMIQDELGNTSGEISCATVHQFQGSERDTIIFDAVESYPGNQAGFLMTKNDNRALVRLINVAITRARGKLVVVANSKFWLSALEGKNNFFVQLVKYLIEKCHVVKHAENKSLEALLSNVDFGKNIKFYGDASNALSGVINDIKKAKSKIVISIPDSEMEEGVNDSLLAAIRNAAANAVTVNCKVGDYKGMSDDWKKISLATENATFPLVVIDDAVVWYGAPITKGRFQGKGNLSFITVCPLFFRIAGKHTVDMIRSLTDIDMRLVDGMRKAFPGAKAMTEADEEGKPVATGGIQAYIKKYVKCSKCHQPTEITRSFKGKVFLKCPSCSNTDWVTVDMVNNYLGHEFPPPTCPQCGARIKKAGLSKVGIWCVCENGHYPKVDEI